MSTYPFPPAGYPYRSAASKTDIEDETVVSADTINALIEQATELYVQATDPGTPVNDERAVWLKTPTVSGDPGLVAFVDFRNQPDGPVQGYTNQRGASAPLALDNIADSLPLIATDLTIVDGVLRGEPGDPPRSIVAFEVGVIPTAWRVIVKLADILDDGTALVSPNDTKVNLTYTQTGGDGYVMHSAVHDRTDGGGTAGNGSYLILGLDVAGTATLDFTPPKIGTYPGFPAYRKMRGGDIVSMAWLGGDDFEGTLNGATICTLTDTTFDPATLTDIAIPINRRAGGTTWRCGVEWIAVTTGDHFDPDQGLAHWWDASLPTPRWVAAVPPAEQYTPASASDGVPAIHSDGMPTISMGSAAGSGAAVACTPVCDSWGEIGGEAGSGGSAGLFVSATFVWDYLNASVQITPKSWDAAELGAYVTPVYSGFDVIGFRIWTREAPTNGVTYLWEYMMLGIKA